MKKPNLLHVPAILIALFSLSEARFYMGVDIGQVYSMMDKSSEEQTTYFGTSSTVVPAYHIKNAYKGYGYLINLNLGNEYHFDDKNMFGLRWIGSIGYGNTNLIQQDYGIQYFSHMLNLSIGIDALFDVIQIDEKNTLGFFIGLESGWVVFSSNATYMDGKNRFPLINALSLLLTPRFGVLLFENDHHRIEVIGKVPVYNYNVNETEYGVYYFATPYEVMLGYKYIF
ncbi:outer membrane beta-barrel protein [Helicobacter sp. 11S03491-1]|uniref:outer membrane beta-barrel protein n=1 Tax=Helicobacter sp. 11S03491-1 TaxID=1476196 RepID=UPI000BA7391F|nr:outer membrane beta-barrel protein [Helicobacter sp. 11S03491-1]PAF41734.1 hypothetical protein BKH45_06505 [Helicobacter sp. 11S03491-1]